MSNARNEHKSEDDLWIKLPCPIGTDVYRVYFRSIHDKTDVYHYVKVQFGYADIEAYNDGYIFLSEEEAKGEAFLLNVVLRSNIEETHDVGKSVYLTNEFWNDRREQIKSERQRI